MFLVCLFAAVGVAQAVRLDDTVVPTALSVSLEVDPESPEFTGYVRIALDVGERVSRFSLHAEELELGDSFIASNKKELPVTFERIDAATVSVVPSKKLKKGSWTLTIPFEGQVHEQAYGLYRFEHAGEPYLVTQLEADEARTVFPCFDEPRFKVPFQLIVTAPAGMEVISNGAVLAAAPGGSHTIHTFAATPPIPTYGIALAVGPYEAVEVDGLGIPSKVFVPTGQTAVAGPIVADLPGTVDAAQRWFDRPYPYAKLDVIVVPDFAFGAMENPGAIVASARLFGAEEGLSAGRRFYAAEVMGHEVAHMWFGNEVTLQWWDDFWLNESFAEWLGGRLAHQLHPEHDLAVNNLRRKARMIRREGNSAARPLRTDVDPAAVFETANMAVYPKGEALLDAVEAWIGPDRFKAGVRAYIDANAGGNAEAADLFAALSSQSDTDVGALLLPYLDRPGAPSVAMSLREDGTLDVSQSRFWVRGATSADADPWPIPLRMRVGRADGTTEIVPHLVEASTAQIDLGDVSWVMPAADGIGYYHFHLDEVLLDGLVEHFDVLSQLEKVAVLLALRSDVTSGARNIGDVAGTVARLPPQTEPQVMQEIESIVSQVMIVKHTDDESLVERAHAYRREQLVPMLEVIGLEPATDEPGSVESLRSSLLWALADSGYEPVLEYGRELGEEAMEDPGAVSPERLSWALHIITEEGDVSTHEHLLALAEQTSATNLRNTLMRAAASVEVPQVREAMLSRMLADDTALNELFNLMGGVFGSAEAHEHEEVDANLAWTMDNYEVVSSKLPPALRGHLARVVSGCSVERVEEARPFFLDPERAAPNTKRILDEAEEGARACEARIESNLDSVRTLLDE